MIHNLPVLLVLVASCMVPPPYQQGPYHPSQQAADPDYARNADNPRSGEWSCRAVGSYAPGGSSGPDYGDKQNVEATESGTSRDEAGYAAIKSCSGMLYLSTNSEIYPGSLRLQECEVVTCSR